MKEKPLSNLDMNPDPGKLRLRPIEAPELPQVLEIPSDGLTLGRDPSCRLALDGRLYPQVSHLHARVGLERDRLLIEDLHSRNGITLNGKTVKKAPLKAGDLIQLGPGGPRFLVVGDSPLNETAYVKSPAPGSTVSNLERGAAIRSIKSALGIPQEAAGVSDLVRKPFRFLGAVLCLVVLLLLGGGWIVLNHLGVLQKKEEKSTSRLAGLEEQNRDLLRRIDEARGHFDAQRRSWEEEKERLVAEREKDLAKLRSLEEAQSNARQSLEEAQSDAREKELATRTELEAVRKSFQETTRRLERYDPVNVELEKEARRKVLEKAVAAVVFIEHRVRFRERKSGRFLSVATGESGEGEPNLEGRGELLDIENSGSGFCISSEGWILTNAHVVKRPKIEKIRFQSYDLDPEVKIEVVFSGRSERRPSEVKAKIDQDGDDMALLKIEPFEGMPVIGELDLSDRELTQGVEVRLFGFPLGRNLLGENEGEKLVASVFSGIVSRKIDRYFQIQSAVYPGNSGGPVVDENGRVLGIVTAVQKTPSGQMAPDIGYVIPIARAKAIWPPAK